MRPICQPDDLEIQPLASSAGLVRLESSMVGEGSSPKVRCELLWNKGCWFSSASEGGVIWQRCP